jgi:ATP-dependent protease HslVU (ClpYQ) peptidase subunit
MSTIVAAIKNGMACLAADSLTSFGDTRQASEYVADSTKILQFDDNFIGVVGSAAHHLVLRSILEYHRDKIDFSSQMGIFESLRRLHPILKEEYFLNSKDEDEDAYETSRIDALVVNPGGVFGIYSLREVDQYTRFWAVGSGAEFALGAMHAVYDQADSAESIAAAGIAAGATFDMSSAMPMTSHCLNLKQD